MTANGFLQLALYLVVLLALANPLGSYMTRVYEGGHTWLHPFLGPVERLFYQLAGVRADAEHAWQSYALAMLLFNAAGMLLLYVLLRVFPRRQRRGGPGSGTSRRRPLRTGSHTSRRPAASWRRAHRPRSGPDTGSSMSSARCSGGTGPAGRRPRRPRARSCRSCHGRRF